MEKQTFINQMTERGYELCFVRNQGRHYSTIGAARQLYQHPNRDGDSPQLTPKHYG